jgi:putative phosphoribosyl transferase
MKRSAFSWLVALEPAAQFLRTYRDRAHAGAVLARHLESCRSPQTLVLGIARGGVAVAAAVARELHAELDLVVARRLLGPGTHEVEFGAVSADGARYLDEKMIEELDLPATYVERIARAEMTLAQRQELRFRERPAPNVAGRTVILVDDGLANAATMLAAVRSVRQRRPARLVVATPVAESEACAQVAPEADDIICNLVPQPFWAVGLHYQQFDQMDDAEVADLLRRSPRAPAMLLDAASGTLGGSARLVPGAPLGESGVA